MDVQNLERQVRRVTKELRQSQKNENEALKLKAELEAYKEKLKTDLEFSTKEFNDKKQTVENDRKEIDQKMRQRDLLNKDVVTAEEEERRSASIIQTLENELKKL